LKIEQAEFWTDLRSVERGVGRVSTGPTAVEDYRSEAPERADREVPAAPVAAPGDWYDDVTAGGEPEEGPLVMAEPVDAIEQRLVQQEQLSPVRVMKTGPRSGWADAQGSHRFNMARFLTLTGSLDTVEDSGRWLELPKRGWMRTVLSLGARRRFSRDFMSDMHAPPRACRRVGSWGGVAGY
jgi:hypothetical protein